jgi:hypothetical protein
MHHALRLHRVPVDHARAKARGVQREQRRIDCRLARLPVDDALAVAAPVCPHREFDLDDARRGVRLISMARRSR